jgi:hypothetical protein
MKTAKLSAAVAVCMALLATVGVAGAAASFGFTSFSNTYQDPYTGEPTTQAGSHANVVTSYVVNAATAPNGSPVPDEQPRNIRTELPAGFYGNPEATPSCTSAYMVSHEGLCLPAAQVGLLEISLSPGGLFIQLPLYNMVATTDQTAVLAAQVFGALIKINVTPRTDGDYGLQADIHNINQGLTIFAQKLTIWGLPADPVNDPNRLKDDGTGGLPAGVPVKPFLSLPARCGPVTTELIANSWQHPDRYVSEQETTVLTGCDSLDFSPSLKARPTTNAADSPTGLDVDLKLPQSEDPEGLSTAHLRHAAVTLPEGMVINPASANGLGACTPQQIGLTTPVGSSGTPHFDKAPAACPDASRIGSVEVDTPVFANPLQGSVYLAAPHDNPFNSLLAMYVAIEGRGIVAKLPGRITPDPQTGRLTASFEETPQLTFEDFKLSFFAGAVAPLRTPAVCGTYSTTSTMTPWSAPDTPSTTPSDTYAISQGAGGKKDCPTSKGALPNAPAFEGGSTAALAGQYKPFVVNLRREDGSQEFAAVTLTPPPGLVAKLAGTATCPDSALAAAAAKSGAQEQASPSCPAASEVGSVYATAGAGPAPYNAPGKAYLTGPYKGAPLSLAIVTPAVAGPFDLGTIVVRTALYLDPKTAQVTANSDPIPTILQGIPLDVRSLSIRLDKPGFTLNPTSCDPSTVDGSLLSTTGGSAAFQSRFQLAECGRLKFKPRLALSLKGGTKRSEYPALTAVLRPRPGDANLASVQVALPHSEFLAQEHIRTVCTRVQFAADACPKAAIYGKVTVNTPLLDYPLTGPVYLRSSDNPLPDLVPDLRGPANQPIRFEAAGKTDSVRGGIRNTFSFIPDVPFTKLTLQLQGGKKGLLVNSRNICSSTNKADVDYSAHNGLAFSANPVLKAKCGKRARKGKKSKAG